MGGGVRYLATAMVRAAKAEVKIMKRPKCRRFDFIVCGRWSDPKMTFFPGSLVRKCTKCGSEVGIHPLTIAAKINAPIICVPCALDLAEEKKTLGLVARM